jgi:hypothetical protein
MIVLQILVAILALPDASAVQTVSASVMITKGCIATAIIDALELSGYRVKVVLA